MEPQRRVQFHFRVAAAQRAAGPTGVRGAQRFQWPEEVALARVFENAGGSRIFGADFALALDGEGVVLKDVGGRFHIAGNERVVDSHTIDLDGKRDHDVHPPQVTRSLNGGRATPALPIQNYARAGSGVTARLPDHPERQGAAMVAEGLHVNHGQVLTTQVEGYASDTPVHIVPWFEAAEKTDDEC